MIYLATYIVISIITAIILTLIEVIRKPYEDMGYSYIVILSLFSPVVLPVLICEIIETFIVGQINRPRKKE